MPASPSGSNSSASQTTQRLRLACDPCHRAKVRCSGGNPCQRCHDMSNPSECNYSYMAKLGKPKGSRNKKTLAASRPDLHRNPASEPGPSGQPMPLHEVNLRGLAARPHFEPNHIPGTYHPDMGHRLSYSSLIAKDMWSAVSDPQGFHNDPDISADEALTGDFGASWVDMELQRMLDAVPGEKSTPSPFTDVGLDAMPPSANDRSCSPTLVFQPVSKVSDQACDCFKQLTDQLHDLNITERQQTIISSETTLQKSHVVLVCIEGILTCQHCRLDSKILLLVMTVLQTVLNWICVGYKEHRSKAREIPAIYFGAWKVPDADGHHIQGLLTSRVLAGLQSIVDIIRLRMDEIALGASRTKGMYQYMDVESLRHALQRLVASLGEAAGLAKPLK
ncbi:Thiamine repressible genes regulatory protein thi5 [Cytospora mali]|uniref:Thiamine repressible genes regulatory protein thi5 n=1 Tax=Cytospora mali TaxID=578113 RepID=A0A194W429_CYTMA|nr:Thiamine repressible genes regulatory protein thi5 [Valsa mali]